MRELATWWKENRPDSRTTVRKALRDVRSAIASTPFGFQRDTERDVRRANLKNTPYYAFYRVKEAERLIEVVAVWSAQRGDGPKLR